MNKVEKCPYCNEPYTHGSALYDYFKCGHAFEKPLYGDDEKGKWVYYPSPYLKGNK